MNERTEHLGVRVSPDLDASFRAAAEIEGRTPSAAMRLLMETYVRSVFEAPNDERPGGGGAVETAR